MPVDRGAIDAQLREIGEGERWWEQREFRALPSILHPDEKILGIVNGKLLGARRPRLRPSGGWLLVATNERLICLQQERFARKQVEFPSGQMTRVSESTLLRAYQITLDTPQGRYRIRIAKDDAFRFTGALSPLAPNPPVPGSRPPSDAWPWLPNLIAQVPLLAAGAAQGNDARRLEAIVERLQQDVEQLQQQVAFLEDLLQKRGEKAFAPHPPVDA